MIRVSPWFGRAFQENVEWMLHAGTFIASMDVRAS